MYLFQIYFFYYILYIFIVYYIFFKILVTNSKKSIILQFAASDIQYAVVSPENQQYLGIFLKTNCANILLVKLIHLF